MSPSEVTAAPSEPTKFSWIKFRPLNVWRLSKTGVEVCHRPSSCGDVVRLPLVSAVRVAPEALRRTAFIMAHLQKMALSRAARRRLAQIQLRTMLEEHKTF